MPNWKKVIVSGSDAALSSLNISGALTASGIIYPTSDGTSGQLIQTDGAGNLSFIDGASENVTTTVKNVSGTTLRKGTPVHAVSGSSSGNVTPVIAASASDASTMPATFILGEQLNNEAEGDGIAIGSITGVDTSAFAVGDVVYVGVSGGYTNVKPTGAGNLIQNLGVVTKVHASNGSGFIYGSGRSNDIPNLPTGKIWVGTSNYSVTSSFVHLDESNQRLGIGVTSPTQDIDVAGGIKIGAGQMLTSNGTITLDIDNNNNETDRTLRVTQHNGANELFRIQEDGKVGIGTAVPSKELTVEGNISASAYLYANGGVFTNPVTVYDTSTTENPRLSVGRGANESINFDVTDDTGTIYHKQDEVTGYGHYLDIGNWSSGNEGSMIRFFSADSSGASKVNHMIISSSGNVGIGTATPEEKLTINGGKIQLTNEQMITWADVGDGNTGRVAIKGNEDTDVLSFRVDNNERMRLNTTGLGLGTTSPTEKLTVEGNISASGDINASRATFSSTVETGNLNVIGNGTVQGDLVVTGKVTAEEFHTEFVSASIIYQSGSTKFGDTSDDTHEFTGSLAVSGSVSSEGADGGMVMRYWNGGPNYGMIGTVGMSTDEYALLTNGTHTYLGAGSGGNLTLRSNANDISAQLVINGASNVAYFEGGNIGIGTSAPSYKFEVSGSNGSFGVGSTGNDIYFTRNGANYFYGTQTNSAFGFYTNGNLGIWQNSSGNVGIGTTDTSRKLSVYAGGATDYVIANFGNNNANVYGVVQFSSGSTNVGSFGWHQPGYYFSSANSVNSGQEMMLQGVQGLTLGTNSTGSLSIKNTTADVIIDSKVDLGIGIASPTQTVDITGVARFRGGSARNLGSGDTPSDAGLILDRNFYIYTHDTGGYLRRLIGKDSNEVIHIGHAGTSLVDEIRLQPGIDGPVTFYSASAEYARFEGGRLGIGTSVPNYALEVNSGTADQVARFTSADASAKISFRDNTKVGYVGMSGVKMSIGHDTGFGNTNLNIISGSGNVGIGTTNPLEKLHVVGNVSASYFYGDGSNLANISTTATLEDILANGNSAGTHNLDMNTNNIQGVGEIQANIFNGTSASLAYVTASGAGLHIDSNVGIGETSPLYKLHVKGNTVSSHRVYIENLGAGQSSVDLKQSGYHTRLITDSSYPFRIYDQTAGAERFTLTAAGNIGIGTNSPSQRLHVSGNVQISDRLDVYSDLRIRGNSTSTNQGVVRFFTNGSSTLSIDAGNDGQNLFQFDTAGNLTVPGTVTAQEFHTEFVSASIIYSSGSTKFGDTADDIHQFTGSLNVTGSATISGGSSSTLRVAAQNTTGGDSQIYISQTPTSSDLRLLVAGLDSRSDGLTANDQYVIAGQRLNLFSRGNGSEYNTGITVGQSGTGAFDSIAFRTAAQNVAGSIRMFISGSGNVGIGTTTPDELFDVAGWMRSENLTVETSAYIGDSIAHWGDGDTNIGFATDTITLTAGGAEFIRLYENTSGDTLIINEGGADIDLRVEGDTDVNLIRTDAANDKVGIGIGTPTEKLHVSGTLAITDSATVKQTAKVQAGDPAGVTLESFDATTLFGAFVDYVVYDTGKDNMRAGTIQMTFNEGGGVVHTDNSTTDIGDTTTAYFDSTSSGTAARLWFYADSTDWSVRYHIRYL